MSSSKNNLPQLFDQQNAISSLNIAPISSTGTHLISARPFYRSRVTPDPFDDQREQVISHPIQRRYSSASFDLESSSPSISMYQQYRSTNKTNPNNNRALISVTAKPSPLITIAAGGAPTRSEIRVSSSPITNQSTLREIRISRPDSPSISINRTGTHQNVNNGSTGAFHISVEAPTNLTTRRQTPPTFQQLEMHHSSMDNRLTSNIVSNRFKPWIAYTNSFIPHPGNSINQENNELDPLTRLLIQSINASNETNLFGENFLRSYPIVGICARCNDEIIGEENGLVIMDRMYHVSCFTCTMCGCRLRGMHFYAMENKPYCESCYINSLEKCVVCSQPITDRTLRATGKSYHARCFTCVSCEKNLDGISFTVDANMQIHCLECFHQRFAPRCYVCQQMILPNDGEEETLRIVALDRNYHFDCYRCENCQIQFTNDEGCYPIDGHVLCLSCHQTYTQTILEDH